MWCKWGLKNDDSHYSWHYHSGSTGGSGCLHLAIVKTKEVTHRGHADGLKFLHIPGTVVEKQAPGLGCLGSYSISATH